MTQATAPSPNADSGAPQGDLPTKYRPSDHEGRVRESWDRSGAFHADPQRVLNGEREPYCIVIPPPNVTARLHLGHALNNSLQDMLVRMHRMKGFETLWMPGTDHAGIATQTVVEQRILKEEGKRRTDFTRDEFIARVQAWKDEYEAEISDQLKQMGCSCDWARQRFTMDDICARAVREAFFRLFKARLIYRGKRLVNWDPVTQTALADDEVEMEEIDGKFYYLRYPLVSGGTGLRPVDGEGLEHSSESCATPVTWSELSARGYPGADQRPPEESAWLTVATTRPETYLGDTAVAVNPADPRAVALEGLSVNLPLVGRIIPIIQDDYVVMPDPGGTGLRPVGEAGKEHGSESRATKTDPKAQYATGFLKVTPAHDPNDWDIGQRHGLDVINIMAPDASISDQHGWSDVGDAHLLVGLSRENAREKVISEFKARGLLEEIKPYRHSVGHSYRSHAAIEPYLSDQWYCRVTDERLRGFAQRALPRDQRSVESLGGTGLRPVSKAIARMETIPAIAPPGFESRDPYPPGDPSPSLLMQQIRNLPHLSLPGATYFVTWSLETGQLSESERQIVLDACCHWHGQRCQLMAVVVMHDHVHGIVRPFESEDLSDWVASVKKFSASQINRARGTTGSLWQSERFDHIVRDDRWFAVFLEYVIQNPVMAGFVDSAEEYPWLLVQDSVHLAVEEGQQDHSSESCATRGDRAMRFFPARYAQMYESWHDNLRDWCISRQLWWGHRIPVWSIWLWPQETPVQGHAIPALRDFFRGHGIEDSINLIPADPDDPNGQLLYACAGNRRAEELLRLLEQDDPNNIPAIDREPDFSVIHKEFHEIGPLRNIVENIWQDNDVLDTWFSSALWPMSTMGWPEPAQSEQTKDVLDAFNPTSVLSTAREIITLWVSRMAMFNRFFLADAGGTGLGPVEEGEGNSGHSSESCATKLTPGPVPFRHVYIHPVVQDGHGQRMSKSLGNGVDPLDIVHSHGADAMRFVLCQMTTTTQDVRLPVDLVCPHCEHIFEAKAIKAEDSGKMVAAPGQTCPSCGKAMASPYGMNKGHAPTKDAPAARNTSSKFDAGRNFCTKLWNATRFAMMKLDKAPDSLESCAAQDLSLVDRWMLSRLTRAIEKIDESLSEYRFSEYAQTVYELVWWDFCDWYLEAIKPTVESDARQQAVLQAVLDAILRLLHPITPFVTEVLHEKLRTIPAGSIEGLTLGASEQLCTAAWPEASDAIVDPEAETEFQRLQAIVTAIRETRAAHKVPPKRKVTLHAGAPLVEVIAGWGGIVEALAGLESATTDPAPGGSVVFLFEAKELTLSGLADAIDAGAEKARLEEQIAKLDKDIAALDKRLSNPGYVNKAPAHLVEETKGQLAQKQREREAAAARLGELG